MGSYLVQEKGVDPGNIVSIKFLGFLEFLGVIRVLRQKKVRKNDDFRRFFVVFGRCSSIFGVEVGVYTIYFRNSRIYQIFGHFWGCSAPYGKSIDEKSVILLIGNCH